MKNKILAAVILILPLGLFLYFWRYPGAVAEPPPAARNAQMAQDAAVTKALAAANPRSTAIVASNFARPPQTIFYSTPPKPRIVPAGPPAPLEFTNIEPVIVLENMRHAIHDYGAMFGGNPWGTNPEITSQLTGKNPKHVNFIQAGAGLRINANGELIDPWGTPYFFHQLSGTDMEIHSAGPDRIMWTSDDLVVSE
jgi:hypothetical protein